MDSRSICIGTNRRSMTLGAEGGRQLAAAVPPPTQLLSSGGAGAGGMPGGIFGGMLGIFGGMVGMFGGMFVGMPLGGGGRWGGGCTLEGAAQPDERVGAGMRAN